MTSNKEIFIDGDGFKLSKVYFGVHYIMNDLTIHSSNLKDFFNDKKAGIAVKGFKNALKLLSQIRKTNEVKKTTVNHKIKLVKVEFENKIKNSRYKVVSVETMNY